MSVTIQTAFSGSSVSAGLTQLATSTPGAVASVDFSSISSAYNELVIYWTGVSCATATRQFLIKPSIGAVFGGTNVINQAAGLVLNSDATTASLTNKINFLNAASSQAATDTCQGILIIRNYASATNYKQFETFSKYKVGSGADRYYQTFGYFESTSAIDGLRFYWGNGASEAEQASNFDAGTITLYGRI